MQHGACAHNARCTCTVMEHDDVCQKDPLGGKACQRLKGPCEATVAPSRPSAISFNRSVRLLEGARNVIEAVGCSRARGRCVRPGQSCFQLGEQRRFATPAWTIQHEVFAVAQSCNQFWAERSDAGGHLKVPPARVANTLRLDSSPDPSRSAVVTASAWSGMSITLRLMGRGTDVGVRVGGASAGNVRYRVRRWHPSANRHRLMMPTHPPSNGFGRPLARQPRASRVHPRWILCCADCRCCPTRISYGAWPIRCPTRSSRNSCPGSGGCTRRGAPCPAARPQSRKVRSKRCSPCAPTISR
jgi:hypothetical protein